MHNFDRGIIKWLPFDALTGYKVAIYKLKQKRNKINKPILSLDQLETLNNKLEEALQKNKTATIYFYKNDLIYYVVGTIKKIDYLFKKIKIENYWLESNEVIDIIL